VPETVVLCGGVRVKLSHNEVALPVNLIGPAANVTLRLEDISRPMLTDVPAVLADLLEIATYIYCADQLVRRGGEAMQALGSDWRRRFRFIFPVRELDRWTSQAESLKNLLGFLSDDEMRFQFVQATSPPEFSSYFPFSTTATATFQPDEVLLFSGGLDSLAGVIEALESRRSRLLLVSHRSSQKITAAQDHLADVLRTRFPASIMHVPVRITKHRTEAVEFTQRTRSFLFAALAVTIARLVGNNQFSFCENGVTSFNLPIAGQVVGARATRSTHPRVLHNLALFLSALLDGEIRINNPFLWQTKTDVAAGLGQSSHRDLCARTVSCSHVHEMTRRMTHCERCYQCIDRRFATLAARLADVDPEDNYEVDLLTGVRDDGEDRTTAESYVRHAIELHRLSDQGFLGRFVGEISRAALCIDKISADQVMETSLALHRRHAKAVVGVLETGFTVHGTRLADQTLPRNCLLRIVAGSGTCLHDTPIRDPTESQARTHDSRDFHTSSEVCLALSPEKRQVMIRGIPPLAGRATYALIEQLTEAYEDDRARKRAPENHRYVPAKLLRTRLSIEDDSLRRRVLRVRKRVTHLFETHCGLTLANDALIQSLAWRGYRINPHVRIVASDQIVLAARHETRVDRSRVTTETV
jgi:7-cyano-7-deazaguanine synthase in queuosine biosynthesis